MGVASVFYLPLNFKIYKDKKGEWRWTLHASNKKKIADSAEGYKRKIDCRREIEKIKNCASNAGIA